MKITIYQVDAFTDSVFGGNPAAVCPLNNWPEDKILQSIAAENNLSETAFFVKEDNFQIRWFTPEVEVNLCGHATLASAHIIFNHLGYDKETIQFDSKSGLLNVFRKNDMLTLDFPTADLSPAIIKGDFSEAIGKIPIGLFQGNNKLLAVYESEQDIEAINPDFEKLSKLDYMGVIVTAQGNSSDFVSRFFAPKVGINEDPVTGSAHTLLIPFWSDRLNKKELHAFQLSKRQGELFCEYKDDRVWISGHAVTYLTGEIEC
ncbi:MAG: PhzF family phenazine biosynthesis protein [Bacteroidales bacterium]|nr:PhzF family phenazine biosynthesis protein [Bacteroidales bacterium]